jgi:hypothetical protein
VSQGLVEGSHSGLTVFGEQPLDSSEHTGWELARQDLARENVQRGVLAASTNVNVGTSVPLAGIEIEPIPGDGRPARAHCSSLQACVN